VNQRWALIPGGLHGFGVYIGSTVHEVAQVVAAGRSVGTQAADTAVIAKMVRVMMLAPFLVILSAWLSREAPAQAQSQGSPSRPVAVPWFAFGFVAVVLFNSLHCLPPSMLDVANQIDTAILAMAMAALGLSTQLGAIRKAGARPLLLALILFAWLVIGGGMINRGIIAVLG